MTETSAWGLPDVDALLKLIDRIEPFTTEQAHRTAELRQPTRTLGLSLGDRACLALALELGAEVYTADLLWEKANVGCKTHVIRERRDSVQ